MQQEIRAKIKVIDSEADQYFPHELQEKLQKELKNKHTQLHVLVIDKHSYIMLIIGSIKASLTLKRNNRTIHYFNDYLLQGLSIEAYQMSIISIQEERSIYQNH